jgi:hypothetical protein
LHRRACGPNAHPPLLPQVRAWQAISVTCHFCYEPEEVANSVKGEQLSAAGDTVGTPCPTDLPDSRPSPRARPTPGILPVMAHGAPASLKHLQEAVLACLLLRSPGLLEPLVLPLLEDYMRHRPSTTAAVVVTAQVGSRRAGCRGAARAPGCSSGNGAPPASAVRAVLMLPV